MLVQILSAISLLGLVQADISHLFPTFGIFQQPQAISPVYGPPHQVISPTTEFFIPEVIVNRKNKDPYTYIPPSPPTIVADPPSPVYLPPAIRHRDLNGLHIVYGETGSEGYIYDEPHSTTTTERTLEEDILEEEPDVPTNEGYDYNPPPQMDQPQAPVAGYLPPTAPNDGRSLASAGRVSVKEMKCLRSQNGFLRAVLKLDDGFSGSFPIADHEPYNSKCDFKVSRNYIAIDINGNDFRTCGVKDCGGNLCLKVRFPIVSGLKSGSDNFWTLQCKPQTKVVAKSHSLKMGIANDVQSRTPGAYVRGGDQQQFRTHVELLRKTPNGFTRHLEPNGAVQLGEDLLLRAHVLFGDGWNYTKLTDVNLQRQSPNGSPQNSINLISSSGCLNPTMRSVCSHGPVFDPPLGNRLLFKAVMFQGMQSGEEVSMTFKISGCMDPNDCHVNAHSCVDRSRFRRNASKNDTEYTEESKISFRIMVPGDQTVDVDNSEVFEGGQHIMIIGGALGLIGLFTLFGLVLYMRRKY